MTALILAALISAGQKFPGDIMFWHDQPIGALAWNQKSGNLYYESGGLLREWPSKETRILGSLGWEGEDLHEIQDDSISFSEDASKAIVSVGGSVFLASIPLENSQVQKIECGVAWWDGNDLIKVFKKGYTACTLVSPFGQINLPDRRIIGGNKKSAIAVAKTKSALALQVIEFDQRYKTVKVRASLPYEYVGIEYTSAKFNTEGDMAVVLECSDSAYVSRSPVVFSAGKFSPVKKYLWGSGEWIGSQYLACFENVGNSVRTAEIGLLDPKTKRIKSFVRMKNLPAYVNREITQASYHVKNQWLAWADNGPKNSGIYIRYIPIPK